MTQMIVIVFITVILGELYFRIIRKGRNPENPVQLKESSLQYEPSIFSKHLFVQRQQLITNKIQNIIKKNGQWVNPQYYINSLGYRGKEFDIEKDENIKRIIVYGGSAVFDINAMLNEDWPHLLMKHLNQEGKKKFEVINAGVFGHASYDSMGKLFSEGHHLKPDYVILYNQWNDFKTFSSKRSLSRTIKPYQKSSNPFTYYHNKVDEFLSEFSLLFLNLRTAYFARNYDIGLEGIIVDETEKFKIENTALDQYRLNLEMFADCARNIGATPIFVTQLSLIRPHNKRKDNKRLRHVDNFVPYDIAKEAYFLTDKIMRDVSQKKNVNFIDAGNQIVENEEKLFFDHVHLFHAGSDKLARFLSNELLLIENLLTLEK